MHGCAQGMGVIQMRDLEGLFLLLVVLLLLCFVFGKTQLKRERQLLEDMHNGITVMMLAMVGMEVSSIT